jgi:hypothetical protein
MTIAWDKDLIDETSDRDLPLSDTLMSLNDILDSDRWINFPSPSSSPPTSTHLRALSSATTQTELKNKTSSSDKISQTDNITMNDKTTITDEIDIIQYADHKWDTSQLIDLLVKAPMLTTSELWAATSTTGLQPTFEEMESFTRLTQLLRRTRLRAMSFAASKLLASNNVHIS